MDINSSSAFQLIYPWIFLSSKFQAVIDFNALKLDKADYLELINYLHYIITNNTSKEQIYGKWEKSNFVVEKPDKHSSAKW